MGGSGVFRALRYPDFFLVLVQLFRLERRRLDAECRPGLAALRADRFSAHPRPLQPVAHGDAVLLLSPRRARRRPLGPAARHEVGLDRLAYYGLSPADPRF